MPMPPTNERPGDVFYERNLSWQNSVQAKTNQQRATIEAQKSSSEMKECSFEPTLLANRKNLEFVKEGGEVPHQN